MEESHRRLIEMHLENLISSTDYEIMRKNLLARKVLTQVMIENIESDSKDGDEREKLLKLYKKVIHRGPTAFQNLLEIFKECQYERAHSLLSQSTVPAQSYSNTTVVTEENRFVSISNTANLYRPNRMDVKNNNTQEQNGEKSTPSNTDGSLMSKENKTKPKSIKLEPYTAKTSFNIENLEVKKAEDFGKHSMLPVYSMRSRRRGVFFFVNIIKFQDEKTERKGAERDHDNLVTLFREMGFTIFYYENLTKDELKRLILELVTSEYLKRIDSFVFCVQTHGDLLYGQTVMEFSDGTHEYLENVIDMFSNVKCPALVEKPKIFFFPFCRGKISDRLKNVYLKELQEKTETDGVLTRQYLVPTFSDILICYGTVPGFQTHRDTNFGSWYVRELCKVFAEHAGTSHIEEMLKLVAANTLGYKDDNEGLVQVASTENRGFNGILFFNPKISDP